jgi:hypothetical protein
MYAPGGQNVSFYWRESAIGWTAGEGNRLTDLRGSAKIEPDIRSWACGAVGSALPWHGRGRRFDPDQVHHLNHPKINHFQSICSNRTKIAQPTRQWRLTKCSLFIRAITRLVRIPISTIGVAGARNRYRERRWWKINSSVGKHRYWEKQRSSWSFLPGIAY